MFLKVHNVILLNMNKQHVTLLVLLDLSAVFETVNHEIIFERMTSKLSSGGTVLSWFRSYLSGWLQRIAVDHSYRSHSLLTVAFLKGPVFVIPGAVIQHLL